MNKLILLLFVLFYCASSAYAQYETGPKLTALGNNGAAVKDTWSLTSNVAGITGTNKATIAIGYTKYLYDGNLNNQNLTAVLPINNYYTGITIQRYGITEYNEITAGAGLAKKFGDNLSIGIKANYHQLKILNYGIATTFSVDVGVIYQIDNQLSIGLYVNNPSKENYNHSNTPTQLPSNIHIGGAYQASDKILIVAAINKDFIKKIDVGFGLDYQLLNSISLRGGINIKPFKQYGGIGINHKKFSLDFAIESDQSLGYSPQIAIAYAF